MGWVVCKHRPQTPRSALPILSLWAGQNVGRDVLTARLGDPGSRNARGSPAGLWRSTATAGAR